MMNLENGGEREKNRERKEKGAAEKGGRNVALLEN